MSESAWRQRHQPAIGVDLLRLPLIGRLLRGRYGRLLLQAPFTLVALALVIDGFWGPQAAARNLATVAPWVHLRGIVVLVLLLAGNLVCMGCPFTLPRALAKRISRRGTALSTAAAQQMAGDFQFVRAFLRIRVSRFVAQPLADRLADRRLILSGHFCWKRCSAESAFCKYVCPLGSFNMVYSTLSADAASPSNRPPSAPVASGTNASAGVTRHS